MVLRKPPRGLGGLSCLVIKFVFDNRHIFRHDVNQEELNGEEKHFFQSAHGEKSHEPVTIENGEPESIQQHIDEYGDNELSEKDVFQGNLFVE